MERQTVENTKYNGVTGTARILAARVAGCINEEVEDLPVPGPFCIEQTSSCTSLYVLVLLLPRSCPPARQFRLLGGQAGRLSIIIALTANGPDDCEVLLATS